MEDLINLEINGKGDLTVVDMQTGKLLEPGDLIGRKIADIYHKGYGIIRLILEERR